ncbi:hypothetical protein [Cupriavidus cauae]|uniref:F-box domain-containing protein n=1 Tax=Cupriavidus cauae TaxID=2608999 RepID=A0A5M8AXU7_9BURK|nr:hypothetical protein [Cupriavidus cauae]KAA6127015.1 hypothetical protein F1599_08300 [Cupriavidus cauae]
MPHPPKYLYEPAHADSIAALSRLGRPPSGGAQTVGVFRFRGGEPVRIERLDDDTFVAIRLDASGRPRRLPGSLLDRLLDVIRSLFRLEGGTRWTLTKSDCREMESWMFALSARAMQQEARCRRERAAMRDRRDASTLSRFEALPLPLLHAISARLGLQDCHALRQVCSRFAEPMAHCVPLLHAESWTTLAALRRALAHLSPKTADAPFAAPPDRSTRDKALKRAAGRISVLPASQRRAALQTVLGGIEQAFPDGDGGAVALRVLASRLAQLPCVDRDDRREVQRLAYQLCGALERLPLADRVGAALRLCRSPMLSIADRVRALLVPDSCWVLAARVVPAAERPRVIDELVALVALVAQPSRLPPSKAVPMAQQALPLAELDPAAGAHALAALFRISSPAMLTHDWPAEARGGETSFRTGVAVWEHLVATAITWPTQAAALLLKALLQALSALPNQGAKDRARLAAGRWLENAANLPAHDRRAIDALLFALLARPARLAAWNAMWAALAPPKTQDGDTEMDVSQIARCLVYLADAQQWEPMLLPRLERLPPQQQAAMLANLPAYLYTGPHTMELFERVVDLAVHHRLLRPLTLWYRARTARDYGRYSDALDSALICLPKLEQAEWIVALSRNRVVPELWIDVGLAAMEPPLPNAALQASLLGAVVSQCHQCGVRLDEVWQPRVVGLTQALAQLEGTAAGLDTRAVSALVGIGDTMLQLHDGLAKSARPAWTADAIPAFVDAVWRQVEKLPFASTLSMIANLCVPRALFAPSYERHFHLTTVRHAIALLPALSPRQRGDLLPSLIDMESGPKGARPVDWRGFDSCRQALWQAVAALPARERARTGLLDQVSHWFARSPADARSRQAWRDARRQYLAMVDAAPPEQRPVLVRRRFGVFG